MHKLAIIRFGRKITQWGGILVSVYSNKDILAAIEDGTIVCTPFNPKNVSEAS